MKKSTLILVAVTAVMLIASGLGARWVLQSNKNAKTARVYQSDTLLYEIDLSDVKEPYTITVNGENGEMNTIEVRNGEIGVIRASCPDKLCVKSGFAGNSHLPVICLPNDLMIIVDSEGGDFDAKA